MTRLDEQIATAQERLKQLKARQLRVVARQRALESRRDRKAVTRRKFLVGAIVLAKVDQAQLRRWLDEELTRDDDRELFDLTARSTSS
jgi:citrate lyase beta subunit